MVAKQWLGAKVANLPAVGAAHWEEQTNPRAPQILTQFYLVSCCGNGKV
jgi:hypothetical protein